MKEKGTSVLALFFNRRWLRSAVFLVVIMGLTWILGLLVLNTKVLLPLAYIYTFMVAFQGLAIFFIFVVFSKQVRDAYRKWWKAKVNNSTILTKYFGEDSLIFGSVSCSVIVTLRQGYSPPCSFYPAWFKTIQSIDTVDTSCLSTYTWQHLSP